MSAELIVLHRSLLAIICIIVVKIGAGMFCDLRGIQKVLWIGWIVQESVLRWTKFMN